METIKGYKGFDKNMQCRGFQYEEGKEYECERAEACKEGFHLCEYPLDVFNYYSPAESLFAEVEGSGNIDRHDKDSKIACTKIKIGASIGFSAMINAAIKFTFDRAVWSKDRHTDENYKGAINEGDRGAASATGNSGAASATGDRGAASATGNSGAASATGYSGAASATGYRGAASATGKHSIACGLGVECKVKGALGCWIVLAEREWDGEHYAIKSIQTAKVDGEKIKEDTWYMLKNGEFIQG